MKYKCLLLLYFLLLFSYVNIFAETENDNIINVALVLEGGAMKSLYTAGVLDVFMENDIYFSTVIGVSAGALTGANYIARHNGRSAKINILHSNDRKYFGIWQLLRNGSYFNYNYLFYAPVKDLYPYDENALINTNQRFLIGATNCNTGQIEYFERNNYEELVHVLQASSSIPLISKPVVINDTEYLDGAIADPIGIYKALSEGYDKVILILTNPNEYRRPKNIPWYKRLFNWLFYRKYPELLTALKNENTVYNALIEDINRMEQEGKIIVIRPSRELNVKHAERDARKLVELYFLGRDEAMEALPRMLEYFNQ